ncbi:uncharacterized protein EV422DRAFT_206682 [Fimicolochytrium jonesii]|uniref:uncharacterized protein n=1 Tax=Fimicolochytrium jonesii TaxID=1396493 RepID=UPI0022FF4534|nr:uncharacterized protein EV422DRAFT_206682 [Fimicolochytrium jonesii]KAI8817809.1 hypothetical protein EV422DRAFT_206682 [Fimicolochytrium jonesii]
MDRLRDAWMEVEHGDHPAIQHADQYGLAFSSPTWLFPGLSPCCLAAIDLQHAEAQGEIEKHWRRFSSLLRIEHGADFWTILDQRYQATCRANKIKQPRLKTLNHWLYGQTHQNKMMFILRSVGVLQRFVVGRDHLRAEWVGWLAHRAGIELAWRHGVEQRLVPELR